jgi:hypothetical protein
MPQEVMPLKVISVNELLHNEYEPVKWIIPGILPEGLTMFAAAPKIGKSMVALAIALRMARRVHGGIDGDTLYLSLDDVLERRLQSRVRSLLQGKEVEDHLFIATESRHIDTGLIEQLEMWMTEHPATVLIVVDVYGTVKPKRIGDDIYKNDYNALNSLRTFASKHRVAIILIHHTRKKSDDGDWINNINGSNGLAGACDTLWYLKRVRGQQEMRLCIDGREDGLSYEVALTLDDLDAPWKMGDEEEESDVNSTEQKILDVLKSCKVAECTHTETCNSATLQYTPKEISELTGLKHNTVRSALRRMHVKNLVSQTKFGSYTNYRITELQQKESCNSVILATPENPIGPPPFGIPYPTRTRCHVCKKDPVKWLWLKTKHKGQGGWECANCYAKGVAA